MKPFMNRSGGGFVPIALLVLIPMSSSAQIPSISVLDTEQREQLDRSVDRGLLWLARQQRPDGSFPSIDLGQPGVTALCEMAFMAQGEKVGEGRFGAKLQRSIDYILAQQKPNGLISLRAPDESPISRSVSYRIGSFAAYNHAISALVLSENYGQLDADQSPLATTAVQLALKASLEMQAWKKADPKEQGGWRYINKAKDGDSDLSITGWQLMFLRSSKNAGFDVPSESIDDAVKYINACYSDRHATFRYMNHGGKEYHTRGMAGAGILAMAHAGRHHSSAAIKAGDWILEHPFDRYNVHLNDKDRYHYGLLQACQAMYQLGGHHWQEFYPRTVKTILDHQLPDGSWPAERHPRDGRFGSAYTTALCILSLSAGNEMLPIFQR